jgi:hypothetical protein
MRSYKFRIYPSKKQEMQMKEHLLIAKNIWNELLEYSKEHIEKELSERIYNSSLRCTIRSRFERCI